MKSDLQWRFTLYINLFHGHFVLWELESARMTIKNLSLQNNKAFSVEVCIQCFCQIIKRDFHKLSRTFN